MAVHTQYIFNPPLVCFSGLFRQHFFVQDQVLQRFHPCLRVRVTFHFTQMVYFIFVQFTFYYFVHCFYIHPFIFALDGSAFFFLFGSHFDTHPNSFISQLLVRGFLLHRFVFFSSFYCYNIKCFGSHTEKEREKERRTDTPNTQMIAISDFDRSAKTLNWFNCTEFNT